RRRRGRDQRRGAHPLRARRRHRARSRAPALTLEDERPHVLPCYLHGSLDAGAIEAELVRLGSGAGRPLCVLALTASTSDDARAAAAAGAPDGASFVADAQSAGRGRGANAWHSPPGENVYLSIVLRPRVEPARLAPISLAVGVAVARVVERRVAGDVRVK